MRKALQTNETDAKDVYKCTTTSTVDTKYTCCKKCCTIQVSPFKWKRRWKRNKNNSDVKAGVFIYDSTTSRILLVQSCGFLWGPPKGSMLKVETKIEGAIREVEEETGLTIPIGRLLRLKPKYMKKKSYYFILDMKESEIKVQKTRYNDANGVTWIHVDCLGSFRDSNGDYRLTRHCKTLIEIVFKVKLYNKSKSCPLFSSLSDDIKKNISKDLC